jgi:hypothetical protein
MFMMAFWNFTTKKASCSHTFPLSQHVHFVFLEAQRSTVESRANEFIRERTQAEAAAAKAQDTFYKVDKELGFLSVERDTVARAGNTDKTEKLSVKVEQTKAKLAQLRRDWVRLDLNAFHELCGRS